MKKLNDNNKLAIQMLIAMVSGILVGLLFMALRESASESVWATVNKILFQDITADSSAVAADHCSHGVLLRGYGHQRDQRSFHPGPCVR